VQLNVDTFVGPAADAADRAAIARQVRNSLSRWVRSGLLTAARPVAADPARIACPTLIAVGGKDLDHFREVDPARHVPGARHLTLSWAGHLPNAERPHEISGLLLGFLAATL
jgi:3-oxoadipate enol-lactonase